MKGKEKEFTLLDPSIAKVRRNRVQFMLDDDEYALLKTAAKLQGSKAGELAGAIFRKHILPTLSSEVQRLEELAQTTGEVTLRTDLATSVNNLQVVNLATDAQQTLKVNEDFLAQLLGKDSDS